MSSSAIFSGSSRYANDFAQLIDRAVAIASLPATQLASQRVKLNDESSAITSLSSRVATLRSAVEQIQSASGASSYAVSTTDGSVVAPAISGSPLKGSYTIDVVSTGSRANTSSKDGLLKVTNPSATSLSAATSFTLTVGGTAHTINPASNTLEALASAINSTPAADVQAVIVNLGSTANPDYRLSVQSNKLGPVAIQLNDGSQDLLLSVTTGSFATYRINGQPVSDPISSDTSSAVTIAPGLTVDLLKAGSSTVTVGRSDAALSSAFGAFATAYNTLMAEVDKHRGASGGALSGQSVVAELTNSLRKLSAYTGSDSVKTLTDLGFSMSDKGILSFDSSTLTRATGSSLDAVLDFLGSTDSTGFLRRSELLLDSLDSTSNGLLPSAKTSVTNQIKSTEDLITANQNRVDLLRQSLASRMAAADALIAAMEQQVQYMNGLLEVTRLNVESLN